MNPQQTFLSDQALAAAREQAGDGRTLAVVADFPDGEQCTWCDCPLDAHLADEQCGGCLEPAACVLRIYDGSPVRRDIPVCAGHKEDAVITLVKLIGGHA